ncbi:barstar family protein [Streptomyces sp. NPDC006274]|uniref:barstar family protein n=1 Tax=unclassified Streptomyces TaxID=2593676 RepID=UPI0033A07BE7
MSEHDTPHPIYRLVEEESDRVIIAAHEINGFFVDPDRVKPESVLILGSAQEPVRVGEDLTDVELRVVNPTGARVGSYYIGRVGLRSELPGGARAGQAGFLATFYGYTCPHPAAGAIWRRWASEDPLRHGEWMEYPAEAHESWLHVVQNSWFTAGRTATRYDTRTLCTIDGSKILNESSFYCELGESVNGVGGYFGSTLDGLADCLTSSTASGNRFDVLWRESAPSRQRMGSSLTKSIMGILKEFDIDVTLR